MKTVAWLCCFYGANALAAGWTPYSVIKEIQFGNSSIYVMLDTAYVSNINSCANWGGWFALYNGTFNLNSFDLAKSSAALAARMSDKLVKIYSASCNAGYNNLDAIQIKGD